MNDDGVRNDPALMDVEKMALVLREHEYYGGIIEPVNGRRLEYCTCGWRSTFAHRTHIEHQAQAAIDALGLVEERGIQHQAPDSPGAERILAALRAAGYAVVKLPEPEGGEWPVDYPRQHATGWVHVDSFGVIRFPPHSVLPSQARQLAAALLAAADKAEEGK